MTPSGVHNLAEAEPPNLTGVRVMVVEDSWHLGVALKNLLRALGAHVVGPVATAAEAEQLISEQTPEVAIVDFNLRHGERAHDLIDRLNDQGIRVIVTSGYTILPLGPEKAAAILQKPIVEAQLFEALRPVTAQKTTK
jgi:DNA-binding NtrC family response regulator